MLLTFIPGGILQFYEVHHVECLWVFKVKKQQDEDNGKILSTNTDALKCFVT